MDFELIDYPIDTPDEFGEVIMKVLPLTAWVVIKRAPLVVQLAREMLEQAPAGMVTFVHDDTELGRIRINGRNGSVMYRVDQWSPESWSYICVREWHSDSHGHRHMAPVLERREVATTLGAGQG
jgi:hypothetical protein